MNHSISYRFTLLLLALCVSPGVIHAAQTCRNESQTPASTPTARFTIQDQTVTDTGTGLMWAKCPAGLDGSDCTTGSATTHTWQEALELASASTLAGHGDWRLPNIKELRSIVEEQCYSPAINLSVFPNTPASYFWSASPNADSSDNAWYVYFGTGDSYNNYRNDNKPVRLVRGGQ